MPNEAENYRFENVAQNDWQIMTRYDFIWAR